MKRKVATPPNDNGKPNTKRLKLNEVSADKIACNDHETGIKPLEGQMPLKDLSFRYNQDNLGRDEADKNQAVDLKMKREVRKKFIKKSIGTSLKFLDASSDDEN